MDGGLGHRRSGFRDGVILTSVRLPGPNWTFAGDPAGGRGRRFEYRIGNLSPRRRRICGRFTRCSGRRG